VDVHEINKIVNTENNQYNMNDDDVDRIIPKNVENIVPKKVIKLGFEDIVKKLGSTGAKVYLVIDNTSTVGEISMKSKIPIDEVIKTLIYLGEQGFVESEIDENISLLLDKKINKNLNEKDVPVKKELLGVDFVKLKTLISNKFKDDGMKVYNAINQKRNIKEISEYTKIPVEKVLEITASLKKNDFINIHKQI